MAYEFLGDVLDDMDIPSEGTLSRVLTKQGPVRLVAFAFDEGQELTEHTASVPAILQVVSGRLTIVVAGDRHQLGPRSWLYLDAGEPHSVTADEPSHLLLTMIRPS